MGRLSRIVDRAVNRTAQNGPLPASDAARRLVSDGPVVDLLVGTALFRDPDIERIQASGLDIVGLTVATTWPDLRGTLSRWHFRSLGLPPSDIGSPLSIAEWLIDRIRTQAAKSHGRMVVIEGAADIARCVAAGGPLGVLLGVQGGHVLENDLHNVGRLRELGVRMLAPAHVMDNPLVGSATGKSGGGMTDLGREMLGELERQGLIVDLAHMSEAGVVDSLELLSKPPVISHTALRDDSSRGSRWRRYSAATRNVSPELARDVAARGGLVGIVLATQLLGGDSLRHAAEAVARALETCGADGVALGSDMDGALKMVIDHQGLPALADELLGSGLDRSAVGGYLGANAIRFLEAVLPS